MRRFLRILGYVLTLVIAGTFIALSFYDLETKQFVDFVALPYVLALGIGTSVNVIFLFIVQAPWRSGIRMRATRESGIILEIFTIFYITVGWALDCHYRRLCFIFRIDCSNSQCTNIKLIVI